MDPLRHLPLALLALSFAAPLTAQEFVWTSERPDAVAPLGVFGDRTLPAGAFALSLQYARSAQEGMRMGSDLVSVEALFETFEIVPFAASTDAWIGTAALGLTEELTLAARAAFLMRKREQVTGDFTYFVLESQGLGDIEVQALYGVYDAPGVRAHLHAGVSAPTGPVRARGGFEDVRLAGTLPYDMQLGAGAWGFTPGLTLRAMNEFGTVGGQVTATLYLLERADWRAGDRVDANLWASRRLNRFFSASARLHVLSFEGIEGFDPDLEPARDPGEWPISFAGSRVELPVGVNLFMPEGRWAGHRLGVEFVFPVYESFDGPWLASDWGVVVGWQFGF